MNQKSWDNVSVTVFGLFNSELNGYQIKIFMNIIYLN